jgi:hypothetical protein
VTLFRKEENSTDFYLDFVQNFGLRAPKAKFLEEIQTKVLRALLLAITVTSTALPIDSYFLKLTQPLIVKTVQLLYTVKEVKGQYPLPYGLRNPYRKLKSVNS